MNMKMPRVRQRTRLLENVVLLLLAAVVAAACGKEEVAHPAFTSLAIGQARVVELRFIPLQVRDFEKRVTKEELLQLPPALLATTWIMDLEVLSPGDGVPRLIDHALQILLKSNTDDVT